MRGGKVRDRLTGPMLQELNHRSSTTTWTPDNQLVLSCHHRNSVTGRTFATFLLPPLRLTHLEDAVGETRLFWPWLANKFQKFTYSSTESLMTNSIQPLSLRAVMRWCPNHCVDSMAVWVGSTPNSSNSDWLHSQLEGYTQAKMCTLQCLDVYWQNHYLWAKMSCSALCLLTLPEPVCDQVATRPWAAGSAGGLAVGLAAGWPYGVDPELDQQQQDYVKLQVSFSCVCQGYHWPAWRVQV